MTATRYFVRDDDVGALTDELRFFAEAFVARAIPVSYQIIPAQLTAECADYLVALRRAHPALIEFGQHGLRHEMTIGGRHSWREFGPERSLADQQADIVAGRAIMRDLLGDETPVTLFTPPQHKFDGNTVRAAAAAGHTAFSASSYPSLHHRAAYALGRALSLSSLKHHGISYHGRMRPEAPLTEMSIAIAVDDGGAIRHRADALPAAIACASKHSSAVGMMLHHPVYSTADKRAELIAIADRLAAMGPERFALLGSLAEDARLPS